MSDWKAIVKDLADLSVVAEHPATAARTIQVDETQDRIIANLSGAPHDGQRATIIEVALTIGASRLIAATPAVKERMLMRLPTHDWEIALKNCTADDIRVAITKGLDLADGFQVLLNAAATNDDIKDFVLNDLASRRYWFSTNRVLTKIWFRMNSSEIAGAFLEAQTRNFPGDARECYLNAVIEKQSLPAIVWQAALKATGLDKPSGSDPLGSLVQSQPSSHKALAVHEAHRSLAAIHDFYT